MGRLGVGHDDVVYDPFVGFGTTQVVSSEKGIASIGYDISPVAVLSARIKLAPPCEKNLSRIERLVKESTVEKLLLSFASDALKGVASGSWLHLLEFVIIASLIRTGWHEGAGFNMEKFESETERLLNEMREDIAVRRAARPPSRVLCSDFFDIDPADVTSFARGDVVMISSPPFFGSKVNPAIQKLEGLIDVTTKRSEKSYSSPDWVAPEAIPILKKIKHGRSYDEVVDYLFFLDSIAGHAIKTGCRSVGLEMGQKVVDGHEVRFDLFLAERLEAVGYKIEFFEVTELEPEICSSICAHRI